MNTQQVCRRALPGLVFFLTLFITAPVRGARPAQGEPLPNPAIAYEAYRGWGIDLMVMNADGSNQRRVFGRRHTNNRMPSWSPDGTQLVFVSTVDRTPGIYIINLDGSGLCRVVSTTEEMHVGPVWSPAPLGDGRSKIVYADRVTPESGSRDLFLVDGVCNAGGAVNLTNTPAVTEWFPSWSPTADRIAAQISGTQEIYVYQLDTTGSAVSVTNITAGGNFAERHAADPDWYPARDQRDQIVVESNLPLPDEVGDLWVIDFTDPSQPVSAALTATADLHENQPSVSPGGTEVVFRRQPFANHALQLPIGLYKLNLTTGVVTQLASTGRSVGNLRYPSWRRTP